LREPAWALLDIDALIEKVESVGKAQQHQLRSRLEQLIMHLLKWVAQPERREQSRSWATSILLQRGRIARLLELSPSLARQIPGWLAHDYRHTVRLAMSQIGLPRSAFPAICPWSVEQ
jgi:hypothetical protein